MIQEEEEIKEEVEIKGKLDLCLDQKKAKRKSRKRCWNFKIAGHLRNYCPYIRCFHCQRLGHVKAIYHIYRIDKQLNGLEKQQKKREEETAKYRKTKEKGRGVRNTKEQSQAIGLHQKFRRLENAMAQYRNRHLLSKMILNQLKKC